MSKICGYSCEHNKSGVCQISVCDKKSYMSDKTEVQTFTRYIDSTITELLQENKQLKGNWNKLKDYIVKEYYMYLPLEANAKSITILIDKMQEIEQESDSNDSN